MRYTDARTDQRLSELSVGGRHRNIPDVHVDESIQEDSREFVESQMASPRFDPNDSLPLIQQSQKEQQLNLLKGLRIRDSVQCFQSGLQNSKSIASQ